MEFMFWIVQKYLQRKFSYSEPYQLSMNLIGKSVTKEQNAEEPSPTKLERDNAILGP